MAAWWVAVAFEGIWTPQVVGSYMYHHVYPQSGLYPRHPEHLRVGS